jgi:hypothetical protein
MLWSCIALLLGSMFLADLFSILGAHFESSLFASCNACTYMLRLLEQHHTLILYHVAVMLSVKSLLRYTVAFCGT